MSGQRVIVSVEIVRRSVDFGRRIVAWYATPEGQRSLSRSLSCNGAECDPLLQARGKIGEVAAAVYYGLEPDSAVNWATGTGGDRGHDLVIGRLLVDVKTTLPPFNVIWPRTKNHLFAQRVFDAFLSVSIDELDYRVCTIDGWIEKWEFFERKRIADGNGCPRLQSDTWYMPKAELYHPDGLFNFFIARFADRLRHEPAPLDAALHRRLPRRHG